MKKSKSLSRIEEKMEEAQEGSLRYSVLECAKSFKSSWIQLGQHLLSIHRDKEYKFWGYETFENYCMKEVGIRKQTALKLLRSYRFLEEEEPSYIQKDYIESADPKQVPTVDSIQTLEKVKKNKALGIADYKDMKRKIFEEGRGESEVKDVYRSMMQSAQDEDPQEVRKERRLKYLMRMVTMLNSVKTEIKVNKFLPKEVLKDLDKVITQIEVALR